MMIILMKMICAILMLTTLGVVPLAHGQLADWHLTVYIYNIPQGTGNMDVQIYGPHSSNVLISEINGDQTGSAYAGFNIAGSDIGFGDNYKICVSKSWFPSVSPACFALTHTHTHALFKINANPQGRVIETPTLGTIGASPVTGSGTNCGGVSCGDLANQKRETTYPPSDW